MIESVLLFLAVIVVLLAGYPVAFTLAGTAILFAVIGLLTGNFEVGYLSALPSRLFGIMTNETLIAVPLFIFMGITLERAKIAEDLLETLSSLFGSYRGGLGLAVILVGMLLAASTGIVGATVVTMGLLSLPTMLKRGYDPALSTGVISASGTLGQIIPPSIVLVLLGDVLSSAYQQSQLEQGIFSTKTVSVGDLFAGAVIPGVLLVGCYMLYLIVLSFAKPETMPRGEKSTAQGFMLVKKVFLVLLPPLFLIVAVLGSIIAGVATITEAAGVGAVGALCLALLKKELSWAKTKEVMQGTAKLTSMVFLILIGASVFSLVFRGYEGDELVQSFLLSVPGGVTGVLIVVMLAMFLLGFVLDFIEITFVVVPIVAPAILALGVDPIWLGIMIAVNLQTSFLTPPFGFALFYLRGVAPPEVATKSIYKGVLPFVCIQLLMLLLLALFPELVTWLPAKLYG
ncbi:MAG TPA: TRAP transporter large permease subunit [Gammaproteobacteria bacterium]|nr:TRAP transporter large permease subunit [Gammaproteobacteria bacterium]